MGGRHGKNFNVVRLFYIGENEFHAGWDMESLNMVGFITKDNSLKKTGIVLFYRVLI